MKKVPPSAGLGRAEWKNFNYSFAIAGILPTKSGRLINLINNDHKTDKCKQKKILDISF